MITINFSLTYVELYLIFINIFTAILYGIDKLKAINNTKNNISRVSENTLFIFTFIGGSIGAIISMILFRHKIKKLSFIIKFIGIIVAQYGLTYYLLKIQG